MRVVAIWLCLVLHTIASDAEAQLIEAVQGGDVATVAKLLRQGADPDVTNTSKMTPLHYAAKGGNLRLIELLLDAGADIDSRDDVGRSPLLEAAANRDPRALSVLLEAGAERHAKALAHACWLNRTKSAILLMDAGISPSAGIVAAAQGGHVELVKLLLERGADVNVALDDSRTTPLHAAALQGGIEAVNVLLEAGAKPNARSATNATPLHAAIRGDSDPRVIKRLLDAGAAVNVPDKEGVTQIRLAAIRNDPGSKVYEILLEAAGGVERPPRRALAVFARPSASVGELVADLSSAKHAVRQSAQLALLARGRKIIPEILRRIRDAPDRAHRFFELLAKMGPDATDALPQLVALFKHRRLVTGAIMTMDRIAPGSFAKLDLRVRKQAAATLFSIVDEPVVEEEMGWWVFVCLPSMTCEELAPEFRKLLRSDNAKHRAFAESLLKSFNEIQRRRGRGPCVTDVD